MTKKKALICGISGQDGAYLARLPLDKGYEVHGTSRDARVFSFGGLASLGIRDKVGLGSMAINDFRSVLQTLSKIAPEEVCNLAGQSSVELFALTGILFNHESPLRPQRFVTRKIVTAACRIEVS